MITIIMDSWSCSTIVLLVELLLEMITRTDVDLVLPGYTSTAVLVCGVDVSCMSMAVLLRSFLLVDKKKKKKLKGSKRRVVYDIHVRAYISTRDSSG